jgi:NADPH-dependent stearoyl-CoA 9-desaturase
VAVHDIKLGRFFKGRMSRKELTSRSRPFVRKASRQLFKDYVFFPALAFWQWPRVLLGNLCANLIRNLWTNAIIFCGHFTEDAQTFTRHETKNETRGQWYLRQIQGSSNLEGGRWFHVLSGHLSHQIEHHLFPDMPAPRYAEIAPRVREICEALRHPLQQRRLLVAVRTVLKRIVVHAWPTRAGRNRALPEPGQG